MHLKLNTYTRNATRKHENHLHVDCAIECHLLLRGVGAPLLAEANNCKNIINYCKNHKQWNL